MKTYMGLISFSQGKGREYFLLKNGPIHSILQPFFLRKLDKHRNRSIHLKKPSLVIPAREAPEGGKMATSSIISNGVLVLSYSMLVFTFFRASRLVESLNKTYPKGIPKKILFRTMFYYKKRYC